MKMKMKKDHVDTTKEPRSRHGHKYCKYKKCLSMMMLIYVKVAATDLRYFARSKFSWSLVHKKNFSLNELGEK